MVLDADEDDRLIVPPELHLQRYEILEGVAHVLQPWRYQDDVDVIVDGEEEGINLERLAVDA